MQRIKHYTAYLGLRVFEGLLRLLPLSFCCTLGAFGGEVFGFVSQRYRQLVLRNLRVAYRGEFTEKKIRHLAARHFATLGSNMLASLKVATLPSGEIERLISYEGREHLLDASRSEGGAVFAIGHFGNWEILSQVPSVFEKPDTATIFQSLANPYINRYIVRSRSRNGLTLFDRSDGVFGPLNFLRNGGGLGVLFDQHAGDVGIWCPLFGRLASTTKLPALLAIKAKAPIIPTAVHSDGPGRWKIVFEPAINPDIAIPEGIERASYLTTQLNRALERLIRRAPAEWFWVHDRWKTPDPQFLLANSARDLRAAHFDIADPATPPLKPFQLLVRSPNPLGDACMAIPAVRAMKLDTRPDLKLTVLCRKNLEPLWRRIPEVDQVITVERKASAWSVAGTIRAAADFDAAILFPNSLSSALECRFAGIPRIAGASGHKRRRLLHQIVPPAEFSAQLRHHAEHYLHIAAHCGAGTGGSFGEFIHRNAAMPVTRKGDGSTVRKVGICPGAEYGNAKRWPLERYAKAILTIHEQLAGDCEFHIFGSPNEAGLAAELTALIASTNPVNRAGATTIEQLCDELAECSVVLSNDTGTMHLAAALGIPTVAIFGSTEPAWTAPLGEGHNVIRRHVECSPCFLRECPRDYRCMHEIDGSKVVDAVLATLAAAR